MEVVVRRAEASDVEEICAFGAAHIPEHYRPLIGEEAAQGQVRDWWNRDRISAAVGAGLAVVAEAGGEMVAVGERGLWDGVPVVWKLYVHPDRRGEGIGRRVLRALIADLPAGTTRVRVEHFAANERAGAFYEREGFRRVGLREHPAAPEMSIVWRELELTP